MPVKFYKSRLAEVYGIHIDFDRQMLKRARSTNQRHVRASAQQNFKAKFRRDIGDTSLAVADNLKALARLLFQILCGIFGKIFGF